MLPVDWAVDAGDWGGAGCDGDACRGDRLGAGRDGVLAVGLSGVVSGDGDLRGGECAAVGGEWFESDGECAAVSGACGLLGDVQERVGVECWGCSDDGGAVVGDGEWVGGGKVEAEQAVWWAAPSPQPLSREGRGALELVGQALYEQAVWWPPPLPNPSPARGEGLRAASRQIVVESLLCNVRLLPCRVCRRRRS